MLITDEFNLEKLEENHNNNNKFCENFFLASINIFF